MTRTLTTQRQWNVQLHNPPITLQWYESLIFVRNSHGFLFNIPMATLYSWWCNLIYTFLLLDIQFTSKIHHYL